MIQEVLPNMARQQSSALGRRRYLQSPSMLAAEFACCNHEFPVSIGPSQGALSTEERDRSVALGYQRWDRNLRAGGTAKQKCIKALALPGKADIDAIGTLR